MWTSILVWAYFLRPIVSSLLALVAIATSFYDLQRAIYLLLLAIYIDISTEKP